VRLAGPVLVDVLAKIIDEGKESLYIQRLDAAGGTDISDLKRMVDAGLANEYKQLGDFEASTLPE